MKRSPSFWWQSSGLVAGALSPLSYLYASIAKRPFGKGMSSEIPVLCVGNFVVGGAGKTPVAIALSKLFEKLDKKVVFLTRGYGGTIQGPYKVRPHQDRAHEVGDEPLLLADHAPTVVAKERKSGLAYIIQEFSPSVIIMDDGFQSAQIKPHHAMLVVDGGRGLGNGYVLPAGPLRADMKTQSAHADSLAVIQSGEMREDVSDLIMSFRRENKPVFLSSMVTQKSPFQGERVIAFCGIGHPPKFFQSLRQNDVDLVKEYAFADHHIYTEAEAQMLLRAAEREHALLVTTTKDAARLRDADGICRTLYEQIEVLDIMVEWEEENALLREFEAF